MQAVSCREKTQEATIRSREGGSPSRSRLRPGSGRHPRDPW